MFFTLIVEWRTGYNEVKKLYWPELLDCLHDIHATASQDLIRSIRITSENTHLTATNSSNDNDAA